MKKEIISVFIISILILSSVPNPIYAQEDLPDAGITPDSPLYFFDTLFDGLGLMLALDSETKAKKGLEIANERLAEVKAMSLSSKLEAAEKARQEHSNALNIVKTSIETITADDSSKEIEKKVKIEGELEHHEQLVEKTEAEINIRIAISGTLSEEQKKKIDEILEQLKSLTGDVKVEINAEKEKTKIKIKESTGRTEEEIENEFKIIEKREGVEDVKKEKAERAMRAAKEVITEAIGKYKKIFNIPLYTTDENVITQIQSVGVGSTVPVEQPVIKEEQVSQIIEKAEKVAQSKSGKSIKAVPAVAAPAKSNAQAEIVQEAFNVEKEHLNPQFKKVKGSLGSAVPPISYPTEPAPQPEPIPEPDVIYQELKLKEGWNLISFYVLPQDKSLHGVFGSMLDKIDFIRTTEDGVEKIYDPENNISTLQKILFENSYSVHAKEDTNIIIKGTYAQKPFSVKLFYINENYQNYLGYPFNYEMDIEKAFESIKDKLVIVKDGLGNFYIPGQINMIGKLKPGFGYKIAVKNDLIFTYPPQVTPVPVPVPQPAPIPVPVTPDAKAIAKLINEALDKYARAVEAFDDEDYGEAYGQANAAYHLATNAIRLMDKITPQPKPPRDNETQTQISYIFETVLKGQNAGVLERKNVVINNWDAWVELWNSVHSIVDPVPPVPEIDFNSSTVIAVFMGNKNTGGYETEIKSIVGYSNYKNVLVSIKEKYPDPGAITIQIETQPFHIVKTTKITKDIVFAYETQTAQVPPTLAENIILHRTVRKCSDDSPITIQGVQEQIFPVGKATGYYNFVCANRRQEQCYDDGSFDTYYDEWCDKSGKDLFIIITFYEDDADVSIKKGDIDARFTIETTDLSTIINEIHVRTGLSAEDIENNYETRIRKR